MSRDLKPPNISVYAQCWLYFVYVFSSQLNISSFTVEWVNLCWVSVVWMYISGIVVWTCLSYPIHDLIATPVFILSPNTNILSSIWCLRLESISWSMCRSASSGVVDLSGECVTHSYKKVLYPFLYIVCSLFLSRLDTTLAMESTRRGWKWCRE